MRGRITSRNVKFRLERISHGRTTKQSTAGSSWFDPLFGVL